MRTMTKKAALLSAALAVTLLSGCACNDRLDALETRVGTVEKTANDALAAANRAQSTADGAAAAAADAQKSANDAVEAVSRMAEKCCRK
ncbi:MAG TPA: alanine-zipper protein [Pseudomonadales bacterium]|jgi:outer membrane murein-binding lipoprotein Lpp|nr:alanine-zipper protein [Pseudomonadales bacterium]